MKKRMLLTLVFLAVTVRVVMARKGLREQLQKAGSKGQHDELVQQVAPAPAA